MTINKNPNSPQRWESLEVVNKTNKNQKSHALFSVGQGSGCGGQEANI